MALIGEHAVDGGGLGGEGRGQQLAGASVAGQEGVSGELGAQRDVVRRTVIDGEVRALGSDERLAERAASAAARLGPPSRSTPSPRAA